MACADAYSPGVSSSIRDRMFRTMPRKLAMARAHVVSEMEHVHARAYHVLRDLASACSRIFDCTRRPILGNVE